MSRPDDEPVLRFRQVGTVMLGVLGGVLVLLLVLAVLTDAWLIMLLSTVFVVAVVGNFLAIDIEVDADAVRCSFVPGLISRTIPLEQIQDVQAVRTTLIEGWGIRMVRGGWMFNVSGFDAVQLRLVGGRVFQMGTDRPDEVVEAIRAVLSAGLDDESERSPA